MPKLQELSGNGEGVILAMHCHLSLTNSFPNVALIQSRAFSDLIAPWLLFTLKINIFNDLTSWKALAEALGSTHLYSKG
jgi:hypothetical protein